MGLVSLSSFVGTVDADKNLVEQFKAEQKKKHPTLNFDEIKNWQFKLRKQLSSQLMVRIL